MAAAVAVGIGTAHSSELQYYYPTPPVRALPGDDSGAQAQYQLGLAYDLGDRVQQDQAVAYRWYRRAAAAEFPPAEFNVAVMLDSGSGVPRDPLGAALWYARAATHGYARAEYNLGLLYEAGIGVPRNLDQAAIWFRTAAEAGLSAAQERFKAVRFRRASPELRAEQTPTAPKPVAPANGSEIEAGAEPMPIELVWEAPPQPVGIAFFVEMVQVDRGMPSERFSGYTDRSALLAHVDRGSGVYAWRVYAVSRVHYATSGWQLFRVKLSATTAAKK
jgi:hypothetical protein